MQSQFALRENCTRSDTEMLAAGSASERHRLRVFDPCRVFGVASWTTNAFRPPLPLKESNRRFLVWTLLEKFVKAARTHLNPPCIKALYLVMGRCAWIVKDINPLSKRLASICKRRHSIFCEASNAPVCHSRARQKRSAFDRACPAQAPTSICSCALASLHIHCS